MGVTVIGGSAAGGAAKTLGTHTTTSSEDNVYFTAFNDFALSNQSDFTGYNITGILWGKGGSQLYFVTAQDDIYASEDQVPYLPDSTEQQAVITLKSNVDTPNATAPQFTAMQWNGDGTKVFLLNIASKNEIVEYPVSTAYDLSTMDVTVANATAHNLNTDLGITTIPESGSYNGYGFLMQFNEDGTRLFLHDDIANNLYMGTLTTPYDLTTFSSGSVTDLTTVLRTEDTGFTGDRYAMTPDGQFIYASDASGNAIVALKLSTPYDLSTATHADTKIDTTYGNPRIWMDDTGNYLYTRPSNGYFTRMQTDIRGGDLVASVDLDLSTGNTFVLSDADKYRTVSLEFSNLPSPGELKDYEIVVPKPISKSTINFSDFSDSSYRVGDFYGISSTRGDTSGVVAGNSYKTFMIARGQIAGSILYGKFSGDYGEHDYNSVQSSGTTWSSGYDSNLSYYTNNNLQGVSGILMSLLPDEVTMLVQNNSDDLIEAWQIEGAQGLGLSRTVDNSTRGARKIAEVAQPFTTGQYGYRLSNDGKYMYMFQTAVDVGNMKNYSLSRPFDITSLSSTVHSECVTGYNSGQNNTSHWCVFNRGKNIAFNTDNRLQIHALKTPHDLSTMSHPVWTSYDNNLIAGKQIDVTKDDTALLYLSGGSASCTLYWIALDFKKAVTFPDNVSVDPKLLRPREPNEPFKFTLTTSDGGSTFAAY